MTRLPVRLPRGVTVPLVLLVGALVVGMLGGRPGRDGPPLDPRSDRPLGTSALVALLRDVGATVELSPGLPEPGEDVALVLQDRFDENQRDDLWQWVLAGGTLVVTDPASPFVPAPVGQGLDLLGTGEVLEPGRCTVPALRSVGTVAVGTAVGYPTSAGSASCFGDGASAFLLTSDVGQGAVVAVGGAAFLTNDLLDDVDNAVLAVTLLAPTLGSVVRVVDAPVPAGGGDETLVDLVPGGVQRALLQLALAFVAYAVWRAVRLGRPVLEAQPVAVASSSLIRAVGRLLERVQEPGPAAEAMRTDLRRTVRSRLAVPDDASTDTLIEITTARTRLSADEVRTALDDHSVTSDHDLVRVARAVSSVHKEINR